MIQSRLCALLGGVRRALCDMTGTGERMIRLTGITGAVISIAIMTGLEDEVRSFFRVPEMAMASVLNPVREVQPGSAGKWDMVLYCMPTMRGAI